MDSPPHVLNRRRLGTIFGEFESDHHRAVVTGCDPGKGKGYSQQVALDDQGMYQRLATLLDDQFKRTADRLAVALVPCGDVLGQRCTNRFDRIVVRFCRVS